MKVIIVVLAEDIFCVWVCVCVCICGKVIFYVTRKPQKRISALSLSLFLITLCFLCLSLSFALSLSLWFFIFFSLLFSVSISHSLLSLSVYFLFIFLTLFPFFRKTSFLIISRICRRTNRPWTKGGKCSGFLWFLLFSWRISLDAQSITTKTPF